jgi:hypothetical protein
MYIEFKPGPGLVNTSLNFDKIFYLKKVKGWEPLDSSCVHSPSANHPPGAIFR